MTHKWYAGENQESKSDFKVESIRKAFTRKHSQQKHEVQYDNAWSNTQPEKPENMVLSQSHRSLLTRHMGFAEFATLPCHLNPRLHVC